MSIEKEPTLIWDMSEIDEDSQEFEWDCLVDNLTDIMKKISSRNKNFGYWYMSVGNFGWRCLDGHASIRAENGAELLRKVLPDTPCTFKIFRMKDRRNPVLNIQNFHHDSPIGKEWYTIRPMTEKEVEEEMI